MQGVLRDITEAAPEVMAANGRTGHKPVEMIKVSTQSRTAAVAGAIAGVVRDRGRADLQAIGAGAVNQAVKAIAIARGYLLLDGINVIAIPSFSDVDIDGAERTAVRFAIEPR